MKPKPFSLLNHFTVPCAILFYFFHQERMCLTPAGKSTAQTAAHLTKDRQRSSLTSDRTYVRMNYAMGRPGRRGGGRLAAWPSAHRIRAIGSDAAVRWD